MIAMRNWNGGRLKYSQIECVMCNQWVRQKIYAISNHCICTSMWNSRAVYRQRNATGRKQTNQKRATIRYTLGCFYC